MKNATRILAILALGLGSIPAAQATNTISPGQTLQGTIGSPGKSIAYQFTANANDVFDLTVTTAGLPPEIQIVDSSDKVIYTSVADGGYCDIPTVELNSALLATAGTYDVIVSACNQTSTGSFDIYMQRTNNPGNPTPVSFGQTNSASIGSAAQSDTFTFTASKNDVIYFETSTNGFPPRLRLYGPAGQEIAEAVADGGYCDTPTVEMTATLPADGTYTVLAAACNDTSTGNFQFFLQRTNNAGNAFSLVPGDSQPGSIGSSAQNDTYTFAATPGDGITLTVSTNGLPPRIRVYDSTGAKIADKVADGGYCDTTTVQASSIQITKSGNYSVVVGACNDQSTGAYTLSSQCIGTCLLPAPVVSSTSPASVLVGSSAFTLTVKGSAFASAEAQSVVQWNGSALPNPNPATFSTTQLTVTVPASDLTTAGKQEITVFTPSPGGGPSNQVEFDVTNPAPAITSISPPSPWPAGACAATITVNGSGFNSQTIVQWNGSALATSSFTSSQIMALFPASLCVAGTDSLTVYNPTPGGGTAGPVSVTISSNPVPVLNSVSPPSKTAGVSAFTLQAKGSAFVSNSVIQWNGSALTTTFVSPYLLTTTVPAADVACGASVPVTVFTPAPGGGTSSPQTVTVSNPTPVASSISPTSAAAGGTQFTLTVTGSGFVNCPTTAIQWNGVALTTTFVSSTKLTATVPTSDLATPGTANVTVFTPSPGGGTSSPAQPFTVGAYPVPTLSTISPNTGNAGGSAFTLTLNGSNFTQQSTVDWAGVQVPATPTFVSSSKLTITIPAADIATGGVYNVTVCNPTTGGGGGCSTPPLPFTVNNPVPAVTSISPTSTPAGGSSFTLTVNGSNFVSTSIVQWTGPGASTPTNLTPTSTSATQLMVSVPAAAIATAGSAMVCVFNPTPAGGTSSPCQTFTILPSGPTFTPPPGSYGEAIDVSIAPPSNLAGATIYYTTDGTTPTTSSTMYKSPFLVSGSETVQAIAVAGSTQSAVSSAAYIIGGSPTVLALPATGLTTSGATLHVAVNDQNLAGQVWFVYGTSSTALSSQTATQPISASTGRQYIQVALTGLSPNTTYYYQAWATSAGGSSSGTILTFTTP